MVDMHVGVAGRPLISIIMPLYNALPFLDETIGSILAQTYDNWELIIVDDCSTDASADVARSYAEHDPRISLYESSENGGAGRARNLCLDHVRGDYVAFMDSDDVWFPEKLSRQLAFMQANKAVMCFVSYETVDAEGTHRNYVHVPESITYNEFLKNTITCSHTIMFDLAQVPPGLLRCPAHDGTFDFPEDMAVWLQVLKTGVVARGLDVVLAQYRKHGESRSANKAKAVSRTWNAYRRIEHLGVVRSIYCLFWQLFHAVLKRI